MAALDGAVALAQVYGVALAVGQDLNLDVARPGQVLLDVDGAVAEGGLGLAARLAHGGGKGIGVVHDADALAAAPRRSLDHDRQPHLARDDLGLGRVGHDTVGARRDRHACGRHGGARHGLVAHELDRLGSRADEGDVVPSAEPRERGVLGEEAVARVDGVGAVGGGRRDQVLHDEVALRRRRRAHADGLVGPGDVQRRGVGRRVHRDGADAELAAGADDADGDLAAIGDEDLVEHGRRLLEPGLTGRRAEV